MKFENVKKEIETVGGWLNDKEIELLYNLGKKTTGKGVIVEIGSYKGKSTICLASGSEEGQSVKVYAIDPHMTDLEQTVFNKSESSLVDFKKNISNANIDHLVEPIIGLSQDVVKTWSKPIELLWIDGDHSYEGAKQDFDLWSPFVIDGGIIAFHDSFDEKVQRVIKKCIFTSNHFSNTGIAGTIAFGTKNSKPVSFIEKIKNWSVFFLINNYRILNNTHLPQFIKKPINTTGKFLLHSVRSGK